VLFVVVYLFLKVVYYELLSFASKAVDLCLKENFALVDRNYLSSGSMPLYGPL